MIFRYTILYVADVSRSLAFYRRCFGLDVGLEHPSGDYGELATGATKLAFSSRALMQSLGKSPAIADPGAPVFEIAFETNDVATAFQRAVAAGATIVQEVRREAWGQTTSYVSDPDGYLVEICSPVSMEDSQPGSTS